MHSLAIYARMAYNFYLISIAALINYSYLANYGGIRQSNNGHDNLPPYPTYAAI